MPQKSSANKAKTMPQLQTRAAVQNVDAENRTFEVTFTTGARGLRMGWDEDYYEELEVTEQAMRMDRLRNGAPFLNSHDTWRGVGSVIGVIESASVENGAGVAKVRMSARDEIAGILRDMQDGILRNVSVGYRVHKYERFREDGVKYPIYRAVDWEPMEISLVAIGFDAGAQVRSDDTETFPIEIINRDGDVAKRAAEPDTKRGLHMNLELRAAALGITRRDGENDEQLLGRIEAAEVAKRTADAERIAKDAAAQAVQAERSRVSDIQSAVRKAGLDADFANRLITDGVTIDQARAQIIDAVAERQDKTQGDVMTRTHVIVGDERRDRAARSAMSEAIQHRCGTVATLSEGAREFRGLTLLEMARQALEMRGVRTAGMDRMELVQRSMTQSDLPNIYLDAMYKTLTNSYQAEPRTFLPLGRRVSLSDFRVNHRVKLSEAPSLERRNEAGEFRYGKFSDAKETIQLHTYGKKIKLTREMIINDDLGAVVRMMNGFGAAAARLESDTVWTSGIIANGAMADNVAIYHATHKNLASASAINVDGVAAARKLLRVQKGLADKDTLNLSARFIVCGPDKETELEQFLSGAFVPTAAASAIPASMRSLQPIVENRISGNAWYLFGDFNIIDTFEYAYLEGQEGVFVASKVDELSGDMELGARHDFGWAMIDHRNTAKNQGA